MRLARPHLDALLVTADLAAAVTFWRDVVGAEVERRSDAEARLRLGAQQLRLIGPKPAPPRHPGALYAGTGYRVLALLVDDLDAVCHAVRARGRRVAPAPDLPGRWPIRFARDDDGNMLELIGRPPGEPAHPMDALHVGLTVADAARMRAFYGEALGLPEQPATPMGEGMVRHAFSVGDSTLKFWARPERLPRLSGPPLAAVGIRAISLPVRDPAATRDALARSGAARETPPGLPADDGTAWIEDPEGGWIELRRPG